MKKILCPTDFSETAHDAIAYAAKLAQETHAELTLLNVQSLFELAPASVMNGKQQTLNAASDILDMKCEEISRIFKISCYPEVIPSMSMLSNTISQKSKDYDLIVMGSNGSDDLFQFFTGSNTYNVILKTPTPLLLIPTGYIYTPIKEVVYAFDYLHKRNIPLSPLVNFSNSLRFNLTILQVMEVYYNQEIEDNLIDLQNIIKATYANTLPIKFETIESTEVAQSINSYVLRTAPDALALCSVHRNIAGRLFHKSVIKNISSICSYPIFVFHE
jgi:nucleotide-binding universal stress UspA family protein